MQHAFFAALGVTVALLLALPASGVARLARSGSPAVSFTALGPGGLRIVGRTTELTVADQDQVLRLIVPLKTVTTGISLRDRHMREKYLHVDKYPDARLELPRGSLQKPTPGAEVRAELTGTLFLHGQSRPVTVRYVARQDPQQITVTGQFGIDMRHFGIEEPAYLGLRVKPEVTIQAAFAVVDG
jgi:polyisoprenoid-binding protein YceI